MSETAEPAAPTPPPVPPIVAAEIKPAIALAEAGMSQVLAAPAGTEPSWAKPAVSILALVLLAVAFAVAVVTKSDASLQLLIGAVISMSGTVVNYWLGSSSGSAAKTNILSKGTSTNA